MNPLEQALADYLATRRALGFRLREPGSCLRSFVSFLHTAGASHITTDLALRWATQPATAQPATWTWRLSMVRGFARWQSARDPRTEVPPAGLLPHRYHRKPPYIYSDSEIGRLLRRAAQLPSPRGLRAPTYVTLLGLLAVSGLRINEALGLDRPDVDLENAILTIRRTKFGESRVVPLHPSTGAALREYADRRDRVVPAPLTPAFFVSERGTRLTEWMARYTFAKLSQALGLRVRAKGHGRGPRLHDMRHRFAARTLLQWYRAGRAVDRELPKLATYLGHVHIADTYWYLEAVPELLQLATARLLDPGKEVHP
jgi:integrase/recombinase XerD